MPMELSTGDGAPNGLMPLELLGDPNSPPEIKPWAKDVTPIEIAVATPTQTIETPTPPGEKEKPSPSVSNGAPQQSTSASSPQSESKPTEASSEELLLAPAVATPQNNQTEIKADPQVQLASAELPSATSGSSVSGSGSPIFVGNIPPRYPDVAVQNRWEGDVMLLLHIDAYGRVFKVEVLHGSGHAVLDEEAVAAIRRWIGQPAKRNGVPVESTAQLPVHFRLN